MADRQLSNEESPLVFGDDPFTYQMVQPIESDRLQELKAMILRGEKQPSGMSEDEKFHWDALKVQLAEIIVSGDVPDFPNP